MPGKRKAPPNISASGASPKSGRSSRAFTPESRPTSPTRQLDVSDFVYSLPPRQIDAASAFFLPETAGDQSRDFTALGLKPDQHTRPIWIDGTGALILETFHPRASQGTDFLVAIAEPVSRPSLMHEYRLTVHSLYAAVASGLTPEDIVAGLKRWCKNAVPPNMLQFIRQCGKSYGKVKLVLRNTEYFLETTDLEVLQFLMRDPTIYWCHARGAPQTAMAAPRMDELAIAGTKMAAGVRQAEGLGIARHATPDVSALLTNNDDDDDDDPNDGPVIHAIRIKDNMVGAVAERCLALQFPALEEYDFRNDHANADLDIDLRPLTEVRPHQEQSLNKMFGSGRAKSGIVVLPCGAGKTLVGIAAACTIKKGVVVLATGMLAAMQWRDEFVRWTNINPSSIALFLSSDKSTFSGNTGVLITTYSMVTNTRGRAQQSAHMMQFLSSREWGLMILDEVHVAPAQTFRNVIGSVKAHAKLGLTATLLREDGRVDDLNFLIGPKLYEASWTDLADRGYIANVSCAEVWCDLPPEWAHAYTTTAVRDRALLGAMNPAKFQACDYLIRYHESRGDKILVFSDNLYALAYYARRLTRPFLHGDTSDAERQHIIALFRSSPSSSSSTSEPNPYCNTLFLSKIGDTSLDLPEATVLIQISAQFGSRRQEAQRLGRILRAKRRHEVGFTSFFYSLVSRGTVETQFASKRQEFLVDQGYAFRVITKLKGIDDMPAMEFGTVEERGKLLREVLADAGSERWRKRMKAERKGLERDGGLFGDADLFGDGFGGRSAKKRDKAAKKEKYEAKGSFFRGVAREKEKVRIKRRKLAEEAAEKSEAKETAKK